MSDASLLGSHERIDDLVGNLGRCLTTSLALASLSVHGHDARMRLWGNKSKTVQLDLLDAAPVEGTITPPLRAAGAPSGPPQMIAVTSLFEDPGNPRTEVPEAELDELVEDIRQHGILQPIVVHPADADGRHRIHFGSKRWRAAQRIGLQDVPVVVRAAAADPYTQVAENQKRHGLTPLDLARFIRARVDGGDSNATVAKRLGMNLTTVAHHLALLELPPELDEALKSGRCTSPRTLHELSRLQREEPEQVRALIDGDAEITRSAVSALRAESAEVAAKAPAPSLSSKLIDQANAACDRLERALSRIQPPNSYQVALPELIALRIRVEDITKRWLQGSDRQTPPQADH